MMRDLFLTNQYAAPYRRVGPNLWSGLRITHSLQMEQRNIVHSINWKTYHYKSISSCLTLYALSYAFYLSLLSNLCPFKCTNKGKINLLHNLNKKYQIWKIFPSWFSWHKSNLEITIGAILGNGHNRKYANFSFE